MTPAEFEAAWRAAKPGSTITIPPGSYGAPFIKSVNGVTFKADPAAVFDQVTLYGCQAIVWDGGHIELPTALATGTDVKVFRIANCDTVTLTNATIKGAIVTLGVPEDSPTSGSHLINGRPAGLGVTVEMKSTNIHLTGLDISQVYKGITLSTVSFLTIDRNHIHDFRTSGIVGGCHDALIDRNYIHSARQWKVGGNGDHADFIHLYNDYKAVTPAVNIKITRNVCDQLDGDPQPGGIAIEGSKEAGFVGMVIDGNWIFNGLAQAITAWNTTSLEITNNQAFQTAGNTTDAPSIRVAGSKDKVLLPPGIFVNGNRMPDTYRLLAATNQTEALGLRPMKNTIVPSGVQSPDVLAKARAAARLMLAAP